DGTDITFAGVRVAGIQLRVHQSREGVDLLRSDGSRRAALGAGMIEGRLGSLPLSFQSSGAVPTDVVELDDVVLHRAILPLHEVFAEIGRASCRESVC